jgi:pimeloyl-ACP methyl ester carboxylesterase
VIVRAYAFAACALGVVACSSGSNEPSEAPVYALYGPAATTMLSPFPSNRYTKSDATTATKIRIDIGAHDTNDQVLTGYPSTVAEANELDGFSTFGGVWANFSDDVDATTLVKPLDGYASANAPMALVDIDPTSPDHGTAIGLIPRYTTTADGEYDYTSVDHNVVAQPARPLRPKTTYVFVVTDAVHTHGGHPVRATDDTVALLNGTAQGAYEDSVRAALPTLQAATGITKDHVVLASVFTTESVHDELLALAADRRAAPAPAAVGTMTINEQDDTRVRYVGRYVSPEYRPKTPGEWIIVDGKPVAQDPTVSLEYFLAFANKTVSGPRPVAIFAHGLGGDKDSTWGTADRLKDLSDKGVAVIGIDAPYHGSRSTRPAGSGAFLYALDFFAVNPDTKTFDIGAARDNFRQMAADQLELVRFVKSLGTLDLLPVGAPDGVPDLDVNQIVYLGHSFGSVMGATIASLAPEIQASCWNVGGDGLMQLLRDSNTFSILVDSFRTPGTTKGQIERFFALTQGIIDRGDPINYARYVALESLPGVTGWRPRDVLLQEVVDDAIVPNSTSEALARAAGLAEVLPKVSDIPLLVQSNAPLIGNLSTGATGGIFQFDHADGKPIDHGSLIFTDDARNQYSQFLRTALESGHGTITSPF